MPETASLYTSAIQTVLQRIVETQMDPIERAAVIVADAVARDGLLYTFGTGHSHIIAEDVAYRAGGLVPVDAILEDSLTGHKKVRQSEFMERVEGMAEVIFNYYEISPRDALVVISNSGRNAAPIEMADLARRHGIPVIAITGKKLYQVADVVIDNLCPKGDALIRLEGLPVPTGAGSGIAGLFILNTVIVRAIQILLERGIQPPVCMSGNLDGSYEYNKPILDKYKDRIKVW